MEELLKIQNELKAPKNQINKFGGFNYRSAEDILEAVKPLLKKYNCILTISDEVVNIGTRYYVRATAILGKIGEEKALAVTSYAREPKERKGMDPSQITGATSSYARKYALNGLFAIDDGKDPDSSDNRDIGKKLPTSSKAVTMKQGKFLKDLGLKDEEIRGMTFEEADAKIKLLTAK